MGVTSSNNSSLAPSLCRRKPPRISRASSSIPETILFPSKEVALSIWKALEVEYPALKYDDCNGLYLLEEEEIFDEEEEQGICDVSYSIAFRTVIELEDTEYCYSLASCELCCSIHRGLFNFPDDADYILERSGFMSSWVLLGRKAGNSSSN